MGEPDDLKSVLASILAEYAVPPEVAADAAQTQAWAVASWNRRSRTGLGAAAPSRELGVEERETDLLMHLVERYGAACVVADQEGTRSSHAAVEVLYDQIKSGLVTRTGFLQAQNGDTDA